MPISGLIIIAIVMLTLLLLGFPMMVPLVAGSLIAVIFYLPSLEVDVVVRQTLLGISPIVLVCIPLFLFAADLMCRGQSATRLIDFVKAWVGHLPGGLAICAVSGCVLFGSVSGSAQAGVVAIGGPLRRPLLEAGYGQSFTHGIIVSSAGIALLIPPSMDAIIYGVAARVSIGALFMAGIGSGLLVFVLFSIYSIIYSKVKTVGMYQKVGWSERIRATKRAGLTFGLPLIIMGGIFGGVFSPTEAAAVAVVYALFVETAVYREIRMKHILQSALSTGLVTGIVFILVGFGQALSFVLSYGQVPQMILPPILGTDPSPLRLIIVILASYFVASMFVDAIVAIWIFTPIFAVYVAQAGIDPIFLGAMVILQTAIGVTSPPFGPTIFTAVAIFRRPFLEVARGVPPFLILMLVANVLVYFFPPIVTFLPSMMLGS